MAIWSAARSDELSAAMGTVFATVEALPHDVVLQDREEQYWLYVGRVDDA